MTGGHGRRRERSSPLLNFFAQHAWELNGLPQQEEISIAFPKVFSFIDDPEAALEVVGRIVGAGRDASVRSIHIDQGDCTHIDLCAESVACVLAREARNFRRIKFHGRFPVAEDQREIVMATGMPKYLGIELPEPSGFKKFPLIKGSKGRETATISSQRERITTQLTEHVNECLGVHGYRLSEASGAYLSSIVGEVLTNSEDHGGRPDWWAVAYMRQRPEAQFSDCHVTLFSFGTTFYESLGGLPLSSALRQDIDRLVDEHTSSGYFSSSRWVDETLWTVYALQEGVSRHNDGARMGDRGVGTADMIEFFQELGRSPAAGLSPKMCLLTGRTHIVFDGTYRMTTCATGGGEERRMLAFNADNDLRKPPDPRHVRRLKHPFPGTLISLRFYLDREHLNAIFAGNG